MSVLEFLRDAYAFAGTPGFHDLGDLHVPFDDLLGVRSVEARLARGVRVGERIAVVGVGGSGKSSVVSHVLGPTAAGVAPITVPLTGLQSDAADPVAVLDRLIEVVLDAARSARALPDEAIEAVTAEALSKDGGRRAQWRASIDVGLPWLRGSLAREIERQAGGAGGLRPDQKLQVVAHVTSMIAADDLQPVLVFDDSDRWIGGDTAAAVRGFFVDVLRMVNELRVALVVAVHPHYFVDHPRQQILGVLDTLVEVPALPSSSALEAVLGRRIALHTAGTDFDGTGARDVFDGHALAALFSFYQRPGKVVRHAIKVAHQALVDAADQGESVVTSWFVHAAVAVS